VKKENTVITRDFIESKRYGTYMGSYFHGWWKAAHRPLHIYIVVPVYAMLNKLLHSSLNIYGLKKIKV
jgi:hypothetical protein